MRITSSQFVDKGRLKAFLKGPLLKSWRITQPQQKPAKNNDRAANRALSFKTALI
jgi:hypothetical protein